MRCFALVSRKCQPHHTLSGFLLYPFPLRSTIILALVHGPHCEQYPGFVHILWERKKHAQYHQKGQIRSTIHLCVPHVISNKLLHRFQEPLKSCRKNLCRDLALKEAAISAARHRQRVSSQCQHADTQFLIPGF